MAEMPEWATVGENRPISSQAPKAFVAMEKVQRLKSVKMAWEFIPQKPCVLCINSDEAKVLRNLFHGEKMSLIKMKDGIIAGMILGDGTLKLGTPTLRLCHTSPQQGYLRFKLDLAEKVGYRVKLYKNTVQQTNLGLYVYSTGVIRGGDISKFYRMTPEMLLSLLNPLGLLVWWLDDGCLTVHKKESGSISRFGYLNTQSYGLSGNAMMQQKLYDRFGLETAIHVDSKSGLAKRDHYRLYLNATNMRRLIDLVRGYIPRIPSEMKCKLNMQYTANRLKDSEIFAERYNF